MARTSEAFELAPATLRSSARGMVASTRALAGLVELAAPGALRWLALAAVVAAIAGTLLPYSTKQIIDAVGAAGGEVAAPLGWLLVEAVAVLVQTLAHDLAQHQTTIVETRTQPFVVARMLEKTSRVPYHLLESPRFLDQLSRARQDAAYYSVRYAVQMIAVMRSLLVFLGCMILLVVVGPAWTAPVVIAAGALPFALEVARARRAFDIERRNLYRNRQGWYLEWLLSTGEPAKEIRASGVSGWLVRLYASIHRPFLDARTALSRRHLRYRWLAAVVTAALMYGPYAYFVVDAVYGGTSLGDLLLFVLAFRQASLALTQLITAFATAFEQHPYIDNMLQVLAWPEDDEARGVDLTPRDAHVVASAPAFELSDLWFRYPGTGRDVLRGLDLSVRPGEVIALVGRNGAGKTTLVKLLLGLFQPDRGRISIDGVDVTTRTMQWRRDNLGVVFQDFLRYQFSAKWNVGVGWVPRLDDEREVAAALDHADAARVIEQLPDGIETPLGPAFGGQNLSGGQWQRIALARLFLRRSRLWILDEPTSAMDPEAEEQVVQCFRRWAEGRTAIVITHRFATARIADRIAVIDDGRIAELGTHDELLAAGGDYARIFHLQARGYAITG